MFGFILMKVLLKTNNFSSSSVFFLFFFFALQQIFIVFSVVYCFCTFFVSKSFIYYCFRLNKRKHFFFVFAFFSNVLPLMLTFKSFKLNFIAIVYVLYMYVGMCVCMCSDEMQKRCQFIFSFFQFFLMRL